MASSAVWEFFASLTTEADVLRLVARREPENLYLEFKQKHDRSHGKLDDGDKKNFSKSLSGFANADGGVLIWGIETQTKDNVDFANALKPITGADEFLGRLQGLLLNATQPVVDGVLLEVVPGSNGGQGYVKCLIPASDKTPHRAMLAEREYWRRTSVASHYRLEHFDLEDMFGRRPRPSLGLYLELVPRAGDDPNEEVHFYFVNEGRGVAKYCGFVCRFLDPVQVGGVRGAGLLNDTRLNNGVPTVTYVDNNSVIHPTQIPNAVGHAIIERKIKGTKGTNLRIQLSWFCENMMMRSAQMDIAPVNQRTRFAAGKPE